MHKVIHAIKVSLKREQSLTLLEHWEDRLCRASPSLQPMCEVCFWCEHLQMEERAYLGPLCGWSCVTMTAHLFGCCPLAALWDALHTDQPPVHQGWSLGSSAVKVPLCQSQLIRNWDYSSGFQFWPSEMSTFFFIIRKSFNRFSPVDLRSQEEIQGRKIRPTLSFGFAETGYIHPINSRPSATLRLLKTQWETLLRVLREIFANKISWGLQA